MRIIKLSPEDPDFTTREMVTTYFERKLPAREPRGQFLLTERRISQHGISVGEPLVFSYKGEIVYVAVAASERENTIGPMASGYPYYFCVDTGSIRRAHGTLRQMEADINAQGLLTKNIVQTRGWPHFDDSDELREIWERCMVA